MDCDVPLCEDVVIEVAHASGAAQVRVGANGGSEVGQSCRAARGSGQVAAAQDGAVPAQEVE